MIAIFIILQVVGALMGAFGAVWAELAYLHALKDGVISRAERRHLITIARTLRFGMFVLLLASLGFIYTVYLGGGIQVALTSTYWIEMLIVFVILMTSWALSRNQMQFALGSGIVFSGWWFLVFLLVGKTGAAGFGELLALFTLFTAVFCAILTYIRFLKRPA